MPQPFSGIYEKSVIGLKKVCLICTVTEIGGGFLAPMAEYFHRHTDWDVSLMCALNHPEFIDQIPEGVRFIEMPMERGISLRGIGACRKMYKLFKKEKFDLIQYCTPNAAMYAALAGRLAGVPVRLYCQWGLYFVSFQKGIKRRIFQRMEKTICRLSTHVQPDSFGNLELCHELGLYPEDKGSVVWNGSTCGIDLKRFDISKKEQWRREIRQQWNIPEDATVLGFVGRINGDKGINELLGAFGQLAKENKKLYLLLVGRLEKQKSVDMSLYEQAGTHPQIRICGYQREVEKYLSALDCYVLASYREGFGTSVIEAEAMELPVIATDIPGPREAMSRDVTGIMVEARSTEALLQGMRQMLSDPEKMRHYGKVGRQYVAERFEIEKFLQATLEDRIKLLEQA